MAFKRFERTGARGYTPKLSIWTSGQIGINQGAIDRYKLDKYGFIVLYYDSDNKKIGLEFTNDGAEKGTIKLITRPTGGYSFSARSFLGINDIDYSETKQYDLYYDKDNNLYVADLALYENKGVY